MFLPEIPVSMEALTAQLQASHERGKSSQIIIVAEGGESGRSLRMASELEQHLKIPVRACVLGHVQRGGSPTARDRLLAARLGQASIAALERGEFGVMIGEVLGEMKGTPLSESIALAPKPDAKLLELLAVLAR